MCIRDRSKPLSESNDSLSMELKRIEEHGRKIADLESRLQSTQSQSTPLQSSQPRPMSRGRLPLDQVTCFRCQQKGHYATSCHLPDNRPQRRPMEAPLPQPGQQASRAPVQQTTQVANQNVPSMPVSTPTAPVEPVATAAGPTSNVRPIREKEVKTCIDCLLYTSPSPRD